MTGLNGDALDFTTLVTHTHIFLLIVYMYSMWKYYFECTELYDILLKIIPPISFLCF